MFCLEIVLCFSLLVLIVELIVEASNLFVLIVLEFLVQFSLQSQLFLQLGDLIFFVVAQLVVELPVLV